MSVASIWGSRACPDPCLRGYRSGSTIRRSPGRCGWHGKSMGSPAQDQACRIGERALDMAVARNAGPICSSSRPFVRMASNLHARRSTLRRHQHADQTGCNRTLSRGRPRFHTEISRQSCVDQNAARRTPHDAPADRNHHAQEPNTKPAGATLHRMRPRGRQAIGEEPLGYPTRVQWGVDVRSGSQADIDRARGRDVRFGPQADMGPCLPEV